MRYTTKNRVFPTISQYIESLSNPIDLLNHCKKFKLALNNNDEPIFSSGNFGVVFKIEIDGVFKAIKCFTKEQYGRRAAYVNISENFHDNSEHTIDFEFLDNEILVFYDDGELLSFPIVIMDWVEGETLDFVIHKAILTNDINSLRSLSIKFNLFAQWLLDQPFAHGDLKPENIILNQNDQLVMIDYDGLYLPNMKGKCQREVGTYNYQHPLRSQIRLCKSIDDYSISVITNILNVLIHYPTFYFQYGGGSMTIFTPERILKGNDPCFSHICKEQIGQQAIFQSLLSPIPKIDTLDQMLKHCIIKQIDDQKKQPKDDETKTRKIVKIDDAFGFADKLNNIIVETKYDCVNEFCEGFATVRSRRRWGAIDENGKIIIPILYDQIRNVSEDLFAVCMGRKWGYISNKGESVVALKFDNGWSFRCGRALVKKGRKYSFINKKGQIIVTGFDYAQSFTENLACVAKNNKYGFIDTNGTWFVKPFFDHAQSVINQTAEVTFAGKTFKIDINKRIDSNKRLNDLLLELK